MVLELLAPICKREKSGIHSHGFFPPKASFPALDGGVDRLHQSFPSLVGISLSLTDAGILLVPLGSITEVGWRCPRGRPHASQIDFQFFTTETSV